MSYEFSSGILLYKNSNFKKLNLDPFKFFNEYNTKDYKSGFCYNNFSPNGGCQYFPDKNAKKIDFIRDTIDKWYIDKKINKEEKSYLISCLLEAVSKVSNVAGVYSAFLKIWDPRALKDLILLPIDVKVSKYRNKVFCSDVSNLIKETKGDILYLDPPYTSTQYNSQYHVLETITRNDKPETHGIGKHRDNDRMSNWCKKGIVEYEFEKVIKESRYKYILFSYSDKGLMSKKIIESVLKRYGKEESYEFKKINFSKYKSSRAVDKEIKNGTEKEIHYEYLFYIEKKENPKYISPLNYIGGKFDTLPLITNNLPNNINTFYDLFGGGGTISLNVNAKNIIYNDINNYVVDLLKYLSNTHPTEVYKSINKYTKKFKLEKGNKESYILLRKEYDKTKENILLYLLICYGFEHQIRFNKNHEFNNPCGNSSFNDDMYEKIISFYLRCKEINIIFKNNDYKKYSGNIKNNDFIYLDPSYLGNNGVYQDGKRGFNGWDKSQEKELYDFIEKLGKNKFILSNYIEHSNGNNDLLKEWVEEKELKILENNKVTKRNRQNRKEIIIKNY